MSILFWLFISLVPPSYIYFLHIYKYSKFEKLHYIYTFALCLDDVEHSVIWFLGFFFCKMFPKLFIIFEFSYLFILISNMVCVKILWKKNYATLYIIKLWWIIYHVLILKVKYNIIIENILNLFYSWA